MDPLIGSALIGLGSGSIQTLANAFMQQRAAAYNQRMFEENQSANYLYQMKSQRNAARNEVEGLRQAGLSPVFADGSQGMSIAAGTQGTAKASEVSLDPANLLLMAQLKNVEANTAKTKAETDKTRAEEDNISLAFSHAKDLDATLSLNMPVLFEEMSKDIRYPEYMRKLFSEAADEVRSEGSTVGGLHGLEKYLNLRIEQKEALNRELATRFDWNLTIAKLDDPNLIKTLVKLPTTQRENLLALSGKYIQEVASLAQTAETEVEKRKKIGAEINKITIEAQKILHSDKAQMQKVGDTQGLLWSLAGDLANATVGAAKSAAMAVAK